MDSTVLCQKKNKKIRLKLSDNPGEAGEEIWRHVIQDFEGRFDVKGDTTHHIQDILRMERILYDQVYYTALANELGYERLRLLL